METLKPLSMGIVKGKMEGSYCLIYVDYRDSLYENMEVVARCLREKSADHLYESFDGWYQESEWYSIQQIVKELKKALVTDGYESDDVVAFFDEHEDVIREEICNRDDSDGIRDLLQNTRDVPVRFELDCRHSYYNEHCSETEDGYAYRDTYLGMMIDLLNLNPARVAELLRTNGDKVVGRFPNWHNRNGREYVGYEDFYNELQDACNNYNRLTFAATIDLNELLDADFNLERVQIPAGNYCGLYCSELGAGSLMDMELKRPITLKLKKNKDSPCYEMALDAGRHTSGYSISETYGMSDDFFGRNLDIVTGQERLPIYA